ncbi:DNA mismatch repair protein MutT [Geothrix rubra]|uniref:DNA mismatch repair protein MutT n=1 Tax=Geothrix rubra TaxID=2927977 RepID=A0ABQ5Q2L4_9BACT|nr:(deoxy)nucleoside triphosphate pyrophosphohydrolase [Geothrix rubra]GLH68609.1 DNA mismatch repair protein MutT [Geothrix rubra]
MKGVDVALAVIWRGGRLFLQRREPTGAVLPGRWELPGGKVEAAETPETALRRELREEVALAVEALHGLPVLEHIYPDLMVRLHPFQVRAQGEPRTPLAWGWFTLEEALRLPLPEANVPLLKGLRAPAGDGPE